jgi:hypothetical protein
VPIRPGLLTGAARAIPTGVLPGLPNGLHATNATNGTNNRPPTVTNLPVANARAHMAEGGTGC